MKRLLPVLVTLSIFVLSIGSAKAGSMIGAAAGACAIGAGTVGGVTWVPALASGVVLVPFSATVAVNALIGCGVGFVGVVSATLIGRAIDPSLIAIKSSVWAAG
jgi:hypothetical protein